MATRRGDTLIFRRPPVIAAWAAVGGKKEGEGPLAPCFDHLFADNAIGESCWEKAESALQLRAAQLCLRKAAARHEDIDLILAGDLQAQCTASGYTLRALEAPFLGLYGACSTMTEGLALAAALASAGLVGRALALTSSHFCAAERQFRAPLDYGGKRTPTSQWTATAAGCCLVHPTGRGIPVRAVTFGRVQDYNVTDINNMGAAMCPAAVSTLLRYFRDTGSRWQDFDAIFTGDLGLVGSRLLAEMLAAEGIPIGNHQDCGCLLYDPDDPQVKAGASGCGCAAAVLCTHVLPRLQSGGYRRVLFLATGALMSQTTFLQGESIPGIAHLVELAAPAPRPEPSKEAVL